MLLVSPQGQGALVMSDAGGVNLDQSAVDLTLDDQAAIVLPDNFRPLDRLVTSRPTTSPAITFPAPAPAPTDNRVARDVQRHEPERHLEPLRRRRHLR